MLDSRVTTFGAGQGGRHWLAIDQQQFAFCSHVGSGSGSSLAAIAGRVLDHLGHLRPRLYLYLGVLSCGYLSALRGVINTDFLQMHFASLYWFIAATIGTFWSQGFSEVLIQRSAESR